MQWVAFYSKFVVSCDTSPISHEAKWCFISVRNLTYRSRQIVYRIAISERQYAALWYHIYPILGILYSILWDVKDHKVLLCLEMVYLLTEHIRIMEWVMLHAWWKRGGVSAGQLVTNMQDVLCCVSSLQITPILRGTNLVSQLCSSYKNIYVQDPSCQFITLFKQC